MKKLTGLLHEAGDWHRRNDDYTGYSSVSIHYRIWREGHVSRVAGRDKILCPDQPMHLRVVDMAVARLPKRQRECIRAKFFAPLTDAGQTFTHRQLSRAMGISKYAFEKNISRGKQRLSSILTAKDVYFN